jgi:hypothetical protein
MIVSFILPSSPLLANRPILARYDAVWGGRQPPHLLCTDGYYRAVDSYGLHDETGLLAASAAGVEQVLAGIRDTEESDPLCTRYPRFKPSDDATAVMLASALR